MEMVIGAQLPATTAAGPRRVVVRAGNYQSARVGRPFAAQLTAVVVDPAGSALPGVRVTFKVASGSATFAHGSRTATSTTGGAGIATSQVLAAGDRAGTVRVLATASPGARPTVFSLRVTAAPGRPGLAAPGRPGVAAQGRKALALPGRRRSEVGPP